MHLRDTRLEIEDVSARLQQATEMARLARRDDALAQLHGCEDWEQPLNEHGLLLKAEVLVRRDPVECLEFLAAHSEAFVSADTRFRYLAVSASAYVNTRNFDAARDMLASAADLVEDDISRVARLGYERSRLAWSTHQYDPQSEDIAFAMSDPSPVSQVRALSMRSWMYAGLEDYGSQIRDLLAALREFEQHKDACDINTVALALRVLLGLAVELGDDAAMRAGERAYEGIPWSADIQELQFLCVRALAWHAFQQGDSGRAQWLLKDSKELAPTLAWHVWAHADRAYVARINGNQAWAAEELAQGHAIAAQIEWDTTHDEERSALVMLADLFSTTDMAQAQRYVATYTKLGRDSMSPTLAAAHERRALAYEKYAAGRVQAVLGNVKLAVDSLEFAYDVFAQIKHAYRAALAAVALYQLTEDKGWLEKARTQAAHFSKSPFYLKLSELDRVEEQRVLSGLTPMQRQIAIALSQGADLDELSHRFSRSRLTLEKQIEIIFAALDVQSRHALRAELRRRNML